MRKLLTSKIDYRNRWFPAILIFLLVTSTIGIMILIFETKNPFFLFSPGINIFGIWLIIKRYRVLIFFLNLWVIIIALNVAIQFINIAIDVETTDTVPVLIFKCIFIVFLYISQKHSVSIPEKTNHPSIHFFLRTRLESLIRLNRSRFFTSVTIVYTMLFIFTFCITDFLPRFHSSIYHLLCLVFCYIIFIFSVLFNIITFIRKKLKKNISEFNENMLMLSKRLVVSGIAVLTFWVNSPFSLPPECDSEYFDPELWHKTSSYRTDVFPSDRQKMLMDLVRYILPGKKKDQIADFLGTPELNLKSKKNYDALLFYKLGNESNIKFAQKRTTWLLIRLDRNGNYKFSCIVNKRNGLFVEFVELLP